MTCDYATSMMVTIQTDRASGPASDTAKALEWVSETSALAILLCLGIISLMKSLGAAAVPITFFFIGEVPMICKPAPIAEELRLIPFVSTLDILNLSLRLLSLI